MSDKPSNEAMKFGFADASFQAAGAEAGIVQLVNDFYDIMASEEAYSRIFVMHTEPTEIAADKLARFLNGWLGGPKLFQEKYGAISIPGAHSHLRISAEDRDAWLSCMAQAIARQSYDPAFADYLLQQLSIPAGRVYATNPARSDERKDDVSKSDVS